METGIVVVHRLPVVDVVIVGCSGYGSGGHWDALVVVVTWRQV